MGRKEKFAFYLSPEKKAILERRYREDGSRSLTAFIERAVDFYLTTSAPTMPACSSQPHQVLCGWTAGTVGESDVLSAVQAGSGAGHGGRYSGGRLSTQRR